MRYARALFSTDRLVHGAAELPRVISLHGQNFRGRADLLGIDNFNLQRLRLRLFLAHVSDKLGNLNPRLTVSIFFKLPLAIQQFAECGRCDVDAYAFGGIRDNILRPIKDHRTLFDLRRDSNNGIADTSERDAAALRRALD